MNEFKYEDHLNKIKNSVCATQSTPHLHFQTNHSMLLRETAVFYYEYHTKSINTHCGHNAEIVREKAGGI
jgi:hypothetical protein